MGELEPLPLQPIPTHAPPLPEPHVVTRIEGEKLEDFTARVQAERDKVVAFKAGEEEKALDREDEILDKRNENAERRDGKTPIRLLAKYKVMIAAAGVVTFVISKLSGCL